MSTDQKISCPRCGAQQTYAPLQQSLVCDYCGSETKIVRPEDALPTADQPDFIIPIEFDENSLTELSQSFLVRTKNCPRDLIDQSDCVEQNIIYVPVYLFRGKFETKWTASFGYNKRENYVDFVNSQPVNRSRVVVDWNPVNGDDAGEYAVSAYAGPALNPDVVALIEAAASRGDAKSFDAGYLSGYDVQPYSISENDAFTNRAKARISAIIDASAQKHAQGDVQRDWRASSETKDKTVSKILVPLATSVFEYAGKQYSVWLDGTDGSKAVSDPLPAIQKAPLSLPAMAAIRKIPTPVAIILGVCVLLLMFAVVLFNRFPSNQAETTSPSPKTAQNASPATDAQSGTDNSSAPSTTQQPEISPNSDQSAASSSTGDAAQPPAQTNDGSAAGNTDGSAPDQTSVMEPRFGNTLISRGSISEWRFRFQRDGTVSGSEKLSGLIFSGTWTLNGNTLCVTFNPPITWLQNPYCRPIERHEVGESWTTASGTSTLVAGEQ